jgi:hypothetical protein
MALGYNITNIINITNIALGYNIINIVNIALSYNIANITNVANMALG